MCTLVMLRRPDHAWPLLLGGNRDEMDDRPWSAPARHWSDRPEVVAGLDRQGAGSWFGVNDHGVVAVVTNRTGTLGPAPGKRSRGELVLEALDHAEAAEAAAALTELNPQAYRGFNVVVADPVAAFWLRHRDDGAEVIESQPIGAGWHMLTDGDLDDASIPRIHAYLPRFRRAPIPDPEGGAWDGWTELLAQRSHGGEGAVSAPTFALANGFRTVCSQLVAVPRFPARNNPPRMWFAAGAPDRAPFQPVAGI